jgi:hypothetical protein
MILRNFVSGYTTEFTITYTNVHTCSQVIAFYYYYSINKKEVYKL